MANGIEKHAQNLAPQHPKRASGKPGAKATWASGAKTAVGTAASVRSRMWFTIAKGSIDEIYHPDIDQANTRSIRFLVSDGISYFSDEEDDANHKVSWPVSGVPRCRMECSCPAGQYTLVKEVITDPLRDTVLVQVDFRPARPDLRLYLYIEAHMADKGEGNCAWVGAYKGQPMLVAQRRDVCLSAAASVPFVRTSVGFVGRSDGYEALRHFKPLPEADLAENGNVALTGELQLQPGPEGSRFVVAIACGASASEAGQQARAGTFQKWDKVCELFTEQWVRRQGEFREMEDLSGGPLDLYRVSTAVLDTHQSKRYPGAFVASLSLPWGFAHSDEDVGGYHVTWPRDLAETAMAKVASGDAQSARSTLFYLACTQDADGKWPQNMWLDGSMHWGAVQMDGLALPVLLADQLRRENALDGYDPLKMVRAAVQYLVQHGPVTQQDRWEAIAGYTPFTMATQIAALLATAEMLEERGEPGAAYLRETADAWNDLIDEFTYVEGTDLARKHDVRGYYLRIAPNKRMESRRLGSSLLDMQNRHWYARYHMARNIVSPDALALVRFGLRRADDPRIVDTVRVLDATLKREMTTGPGWVRSSEDGYGESDSGKPFLKTGVGRAWPLLAGERGHYEIERGNHAYALELLKTMGRQTSACGMIPEQVWDAPDLPKQSLYNGHPTGSGMPLVWAHSEYIKLLRSLHENRVWDCPPQTRERYVEKQTASAVQIWTPEQRRAALTLGKDLRVDLPGAATVRWKGKEFRTEDSGFGVYTVRLGTSELGVGEKVEVKVRYGTPQGGRKGEKFSMAVRERSFC